VKIRFSGLDYKKSKPGREKIFLTQQGRNGCKNKQKAADPNNLMNRPNGRADWMHKEWSGRRGSNPRRSAWEADLKARVYWLKNSGLTFLDFLPIFASIVKERE